MTAKKVGVVGQNGAHVFQDANETGSDSAFIEILRFVLALMNMELKQKKNHAQIANVS